MRIPRPYSEDQGLSKLGIRTLSVVISDYKYGYLDYNPSY